MSASKLRYRPAVPVSVTNEAQSAPVFHRHDKQDDKYRGGPLCTLRRLHHEETPRGSGWWMLVAFNIVLSILLLVALAAQHPGGLMEHHQEETSAESSGGTTKSLDAMAEQIIQLSQEINKEREHSHEIELEEEGLKRSLEDQKQENERLKQELLANTRKGVKESTAEKPKTNVRTGAGRAEEEAVKMKLQSTHDDLAKDIQQKSREEVLKKWGEGPHRVRFDFDLPMDGSPAAENSLTFEMAPLDLMPHSIHLFLRQVEQGLWDDDCRITHNLSWGILMGPDEEQENKFRHAEAHHLSFAEHSHDYPHQTFRLGFASKPGKEKGPILRIDTAERYKEKKGEIDPCFGKIVDGFDVLERMQKMSLAGGDKNLFGSFALVKPVVIKKATVLRN